MEDTILNAGTPDPDDDQNATNVEAVTPDFTDAPTYVASGQSDDLTPKGVDSPDLNADGSSALRLALDAILLKEAAFRELLQSGAPLRRGLTILIGALLVAAVGQALGTVLDVATSPPWERVQAVVTNQIGQLPAVQELMRDPEAAPVFKAMLRAVFRFLRFVTPSWGGALASLCLSPVLGLIGWGVYGVLSQALARLMGGRAPTSHFLGALALAYAPMLLRAANLLPGTAPVNGVVAWWVLATSYLAVKTAHDLSWARSLGAILLPRVVVALLVFGGFLIMAVAAPAVITGAGG